MTEFKKCNLCGKIKLLSEFHKQPHGKHGVMGQCKKCKKAYRKKYVEENIEKIRQYRLDHKNEIREYHKKYRKNNPDAIKIWRANNSDKTKKYWQKANKLVSLSPSLKLRNTIRAGMLQSLKKGKDGNRWESLVNYTLQDLMAYLEKQFKKGMSWENRGSWHIHHKIPINLWKFNTYKDREFKQCWALSNLQPLWAKENRSRRDRV